MAARKFHFETQPGGGDRATVQASGGIVEIRGGTSVAMCRGAYEYLRGQCHCQVSWSGDNLKLPNHLPDVSPFKVESNNRFRHYFNVCTFGYTTVWWDWKRWQHEIDWMALHGINMPLAMNGQELIWQKVFRSMGLPQSSLDRFFTGPAFLPWHRMGNLDGHMGPLSALWIAGQAELQKRVLARETELGMHPVTPGFSGFVPVDFQKYFPGVKLESPTNWAGFAATKFVSPLDPMFVTLGTKFIQAYRKEFGSDHLYLCDTFNEMDPQFPPKEELPDLAATGKAVFDSIKAADPDGTWVTQGWLFYNARAYWTNARTSAMLGSVPAGKLVVLDLASNEHEVWRDQPAVRDGGWIFNTLHNYGQSTNLQGNLQGYVDVAQRAASDSGHGRMLGMGLTPEGIDQNPVVYELMTDVMWHPELNRVSEWLPTYSQSRYGAASPEANRAWAILQETLYGRGGGFSDPWRYRPKLAVSYPTYDIAQIREAASNLLQARQFSKNDLYQRDLVDVTKTWLGGIADDYLCAALDSFDDDKARYNTYRDKFLEALHDLDEVMATRPEHRLSTWIRAARSWGKDDSEKRRLEQNARLQVTVWGGPELYDYANKEWAGLNQDFIRGRWQVMFKALESAGSTRQFQAPDFQKWELNWAMSGKPILESPPGDSLEVCKHMMAKYESVDPNPEKLLGLDANQGIAVGKPVTDSGHTEAGHPPSLVTDGRLIGNYWAASPAPQWVQIDLEKVHSVDRVSLFPYFGDGRSYQFKIEGSLDGKEWKLLSDRSTNTEVATLKGYTERFRRSELRFLRVTMLHNSANVGVHLYEVRIFEARSNV